MRSTKSFVSIIALSAALIALLTLSSIGHAPASTAPDSRLPRGTLITLCTRYALCSHTRTAFEALVCSAADVDAAGLAALYPDWQVTAFSNEGATLARTLPGPCGAHYLVALDGNRVTLSQLRDGVMTVLGTADAAPAALDPELTARLMRGVVTDTLSQAEALIESLNS